MNKELNVVYQSDEAYAKYLRASICSLIENNQFFDIKIHILDGGVSKKTIVGITNLVNKYKDNRVYFYNTRKYEDFCKENAITSWHNKWVTWYKTFAISDLKNVKSDRVLYINPHCLVPGNLKGLLDFEFDGKLFGLSYDWIVTEKHKKAIGLKPTDGYYNCGIMLINYKKWIDDNVTEKDKKLLAKKSDYLIVDQDFINSCYKNEIKYLGTAKYNIGTRYYTNKIKNIYKTFRFNDKNYHNYDDLVASIANPCIIYHKPLVNFAPYDGVFALWNKYYRLSGQKEIAKAPFSTNLIWKLRLFSPDVVSLRLEYWYVIDRYDKVK